MREQEIIISLVSIEHRRVMFCSIQNFSVLPTSHIADDSIGARYMHTEATFKCKINIRSKLVC